MVCQFKFINELSIIHKFDTIPRKIHITLYIQRRRNSDINKNVTITCLKLRTEASQFRQVWSDYQVGALALSLKYTHPNAITLIMYRLAISI